MDIFINDFKLSNSIGHIVNVVANKMKFELEQSFLNNGYDITAQQWMVLSIIYENEGINQNELALKSKKDKTNIARIVDKLKNKNYIERISSSNDKRALNIFTTILGKNTKEELSKLAIDVINNSTKNISLDEQTICMNVLKKIYTNLS